jgi:ATP-dependent DNA helicase RecG
VELLAHFSRTNRTKFRDQVVRPLLEMELLAYTIPSRPNSRLQRYVTTDTGRARLAAQGAEAE